MKILGINLLSLDIAGRRDSSASIEAVYAILYNGWLS